MRHSKPVRLETAPTGPDTSGFRFAERAEHEEKPSFEKKLGFFALNLNMSERRN